MSLKTNYRDGDSFTRKSKREGYRSRASYKLKEILKKDCRNKYTITVFCEEKNTAYDRVSLSSYFDGKTKEELSLVPKGYYKDNGIEVFIGERATSIDIKSKMVKSSEGREIYYDTLVFATGSYPFVPPIQGSKQFYFDGYQAFKCGDHKEFVHVYRTIDDLDAIKEHDYEWESLIELERGCPYTCTFCEVGDRHWTKIIKQDYDKMIKEIDWVSKHKIEYLHLIDNNFGMYKNHRIISDLLIDKLETTGYPNALNITWAKHKKPYLFDIAEDLWKVGLNKSVTIALQSMNYQTLKAVERANENTNLKEVVAYLKTRGMPAYIETILGLPEETLDSFKEGLFFTKHKPIWRSAFKSIRKI